MLVFQDKWLEVSNFLDCARASSRCNHTWSRNAGPISIEDQQLCGKFLGEVGCLPWNRGFDVYIMGNHVFRRLALLNVWDSGKMSSELRSASATISSAIT